MDGQIAQLDRAYRESHDPLEGARLFALLVRAGRDLEAAKLGNKLTRGARSMLSNFVRAQIGPIVGPDLKRIEIELARRYVAEGSGRPVTPPTNTARLVELADEIAYEYACVTERERLSAETGSVEVDCENVLCGRWDGLNGNRCSCGDRRFYFARAIDFRFYDPSVHPSHY